MPKTINGGLLIVFEGIDGAGKTTQLQMANEELAKDGWEPVVRRNMGGTPIGEELRKVMISPIPRPSKTSLYISAAVQAALIEEVAKDRAAGSLILMDRGPLSLAAYEMYGSGLDAALVWPHVEEGMKELRPELMIIYRADVAASLERAKRQSAQPDYFENQPLEYFERVAHGYDEMSGRFPKTAVLDADTSMDDAHAKTMRLIKEAIAKSS